MAAKYYEYNFKSEPDDSLKCLICLEVAKDPMQHGPCGRLFCGECIEEYGDNSCPNCREEYPEYFPDTKSLRDIKGLSVRCDNVERGCKWKGTVGTVENHLQTACGYTDVLCPYECMVDGEYSQIKRKDLESHRKRCPNRDYECKRCGEKGTYNGIKKEHNKVCRKKVVKCPNSRCSLSMKREKIEEHIEVFCSYSEAACKYETIGCNVMKTRKDLKQHEDGDYKTHFYLALEKVELLESTQLELDLAQDKICELETAQVELNIAKEKMRRMAIDYQAKLTTANETIAKLESTASQLPSARRKIAKLEAEKREFTKKESDKNSCKVS